MKRIASVLLCLVIVFMLAPLRQTYADTAITSVSVSIAAPTDNAEPSYEPVMPSGAHYRAENYTTTLYKNGVFWEDKTTNERFGPNYHDKFTAGHEYHVQILLTANNGYYFSDNLSATINGFDVDVLYVYTDGNGCRMDLTFDPPTEIHYASMRIDAPVMAQLPDYTPEFYNFSPYYSADYTNSSFKNDVIWTDVTEGKTMKPDVDVFQAEHVYRVTIWLTPNYGLHFSSDVTGIINYEQADAIYRSDLNQANFSYTFPAVPEIKIGWDKVDGKWYYYTDHGYQLRGFQDIDGVRYYFDKSGAMVTGWKEITIERDHIDHGEYYVTDWFYFRAGGAMATGWQKVGGKWYFLRPEEDDDWLAYPYHAKGSMETGWKQSGGKWYYLTGSGAMATGWQKIGTKWYWFEGSGEMVTGWKQINSKWYWFESSGTMITGWRKINNKWYYFNAGGDMKIGWLKLSNKWYYFDSSGAMVTGSKVINGKTYYFDNNGSCLNP